MKKITSMQTAVKLSSFAHTAQTKHYSSLREENN